MRPDEHILAESENFIVSHIFETAFLISKKTGSETEIGDFYGYPECAIIDKNEKWCAVGGCGLIVYKIQEPFREYQYHCFWTDQWDEFGRDASDVWWISKLEQISDNRFQFEIEPGGDHAGVYEMLIGCKSPLNYSPWP